MEERFFCEDTVALREDPSIIAYVESTWRDIDSGSFPQPEDWIYHRGVSKKNVRQCFREGRPPNNHVIVRFENPDAGITLIKESALILIDRGLTCGDVVKRTPSDIESGYVIKTFEECTIEPIYTDLPWSNQYPWPHKEEESRLRVPAEELMYQDFQDGDYVLYDGWVGEVSDLQEEVTIKLSNGSVVRVNDIDQLESAHYHQIEKDDTCNLVAYLQQARRAINNASASDHTATVGFFYTGQVVFTKKSNLRLGHWIIGSYNPSVPPRGIVVDYRVISLSVDWMSCNYFSSATRTERPPGVLTTGELDEVKLYNRNNLTSNSGLTSNDYGSRTGSDMGIGDVVKFRDITGAEVKYSASSPSAKDAGVFRRIPRQSTLGFEMNCFRVRSTSQTSRVQWQDGSVSEIASTKLVPYLNVDEHDLWIGELCSLKSAETSSAGLIRLNNVGVVQSVDARERTVRVKWYKSPNVSIFENHLGILESGSHLGDLSEEVQTLSLYEVHAYPALTKRRGDLVVIAPTECTPAGPEAARPPDPSWAPRRIGAFAFANLIPPQSVQAEPAQVVPNEELRWFGQVVDLGLDGLLTVRLGGLDRVEDVRVPVTRVTVIVGGDDDEAMSMGPSFYDDELDLRDEDDYTSTEEEDFIQQVIYEGGERMDTASNDDDWEDEDEDEDEDGDSDSNGDDEMPDADSRAKANGTPPSSTGHNPPLPGIDRQPMLQTHAEYNFETLSDMPPQFEVLSDPPPSNHHFLKDKVHLSAALLRRIRKEHAIMSDSLPSGIWVRTWDERLDLLRILIVGPRGTPYELAPFVLDFHFKDTFPTSPPVVHFHSWTYGVGRINPNLYEDGKVCLSVLGTWPEGDAGEGWNKDKSSVLQVLVSLMGLVLVEKPYYNEAGFESLVGSEETILPSKIYTEKAYCMAKGFLAHALSHDIGSMDSILTWLYLSKQGPQLLALAVEESKAKIAKDKNEEDRLSAGAEVLLKRHLNFLEKRLADLRA